MSNRTSKASESLAFNGGTLTAHVNQGPDPKALGFDNIERLARNDAVFSTHDNGLAVNDMAAGDRLRAPLQALVQSAATNDDLASEVEFLAPSVDVTGQDGYFSYTDRTGGINTMTSLADLRRAINGSPKLIDGNGTEVAAFCESFALGSEIDEDRSGDVQLAMRERIAEIMDLISLYRLQKALTALTAIATNSAHTWGSSANPDGDLRGKIITAHTASGYRPTRAYFDQTAWSLRQGAYEAQATAGAFQGTLRNESSLASYLGLEAIKVSRALAKDSGGTIASVFSSKVLLFRNMASASRRDTSIAKTFWCADNGQRFRVHQRQVSEKVWRVAVTFRELTLITGSVTGNPVRQLTIS